MSEFLIRFVSKDDSSCVEKEFHVCAKSRLEALNSLLQMENVKEIILLKRLFVY